MYLSRASAWTATGPQSAATKTYDSIKAALDSSTDLARYDYEVFLQGSYANSTNIDGESDIDVVVMFTTIYQPDVSRLSSFEKATYERHRVPATTERHALRDAVHRALVHYYGSDHVESKNKCLRVSKRPGYLDADVVPCIQHRRYLDYSEVGEPRFVEGVSIKPLDGEGLITNFPKEHKKNGRSKNLVTDERYKPTVRQLKQLKRACINDGCTRAAEVPGYVLECLTYNGDSDLFAYDDADRLIKVMSWLSSQTPESLAKMIWSCDHIHKLFRDDPGKHNQYIVHDVLQEMWERL